MLSPERRRYAEITNLPLPLIIIMLHAFMLLIGITLAS